MLMQHSDTTGRTHGPMVTLFFNMRARTRKYVNRILNKFFAAMIIKCISVQDIRVSQFCFFTIFRSLPFFVMENLIYTLNHFIGMENPRTPCGRQYGTLLFDASWFTTLIATCVCFKLIYSIHIKHTFHTRAVCNSILVNNL